MHNVTSDHVDLFAGAGRSSFEAPPPDTEDTARQI